MTSTSSSSHRSSLLSDKGCVVIDIGNVYTKIGMSGEPAPRFIIASKTRIKSSGKVSKCTSMVYSITTPTASKCNG